MVIVCCVPRCYKGQHFFTFPKDRVLRKQWIARVPRDNWSITQYTRICDFHFEKTDIINSDVLKQKDGNEIVIKRDRWSLKSNSIPSIFENKYKRKKPIALYDADPSENSDDEKKRVEDDKILSIREIPQHNDAFNAQNFTICYRNHKIFFLKICLQKIPKIICSLAICSDFQIEVYQLSKKIHSSEFMTAIGESLKCDLYSKLKILLELLDNEVKDPLCLKEEPDSQSSEFISCNN